MRYWLIIAVLITIPVLKLGAQGADLSPRLVGSAGGNGNAGNLNISWSTGEMVISTKSTPGFLFTQGFQQPVGRNDLMIELNKSNAACLNSNDGAAGIRVLDGTGPYEYIWTPSVSVSDTAFNLSPGDYTIVVNDAIGRTDTVKFTIAIEVDAGCDIHIYNGFTPNNDGRNDTWEIDGIHTYPDNTVQIYNRWGDKVWEASAYNNNDIVWTGTNKGGQPLPEGTYFYIVSITGNQFTGWVELTR